MTYGPPLAEGAPDDGADRGIFFVAYMADIERQYEFIQANWCNDGDAVHVGHDRDPFIGRAPGDHKFTIPGDVPKFVHPLVELVTTRGGEYLWVPPSTDSAASRTPTGPLPRRSRRHTRPRACFSAPRSLPSALPSGSRGQARRASCRRRLRGNRRRRGCGLGPVGGHGARTTRFVPSRRRDCRGASAYRCGGATCTGSRCACSMRAVPPSRRTCSSRPRTGSRRDATRHRSRLATSRSSRRCSVSARRTGR